MIPQKLIEEIDTLLLEELGVGYNYPRVYAHRTIGKAAILVRQAIEEGDLELTKIPPKLPGEVERKGFLLWARLADWAYEMFTARKATEFIAFRPEEKDEDH